MKLFNSSIAIISLAIIVFTLFYKGLKKSSFNETLLSMVVGILLSPFVFNIMDMTQWGNKEEIMDMACRLTIAMALMATAFRIPLGYLNTNKKVQTTMLLLVMPAMFLTSAVIVHFVIGLDWLLSLLIGAIITPTDPVLAGTIITGEKAEEILPARVRDTISFEAGANDGLAYPFVSLCLLLIQKPGEAWKEWVTKSILQETLGAIALGLVIGYLLGKLLTFCTARKFTGKPAILAFALSVAFFVLTGLEIIGVNSILSIFVAGLMLNKTLTTQQDYQETEIQEMMARLFTIPIFILFGLIIPWQQWFLLGWKAIAVVILVLVFRRLPFLFAFKPLLKDFKIKDIAFMGWFGPMGAAALFYCFYSYKKLHIEEIWTITSLVVFSSVIMHGVTAYPLLKKYGREGK